MLKKRWLALFLALVLLFCCFVPVYAEEGEEDNAGRPETVYYSFGYGWRSVLDTAQYIGDACYLSLSTAGNYHLSSQFSETASNLKLVWEGQQYTFFPGSQTYTVDGKSYQLKFPIVKKDNQYQISFGDFLTAFHLASRNGTLNLNGEDLQSGYIILPDLAALGLTEEHTTYFNALSAPLIVVNFRNIIEIDGTRKLSDEEMWDSISPLTGFPRTVRWLDLTQRGLEQGWNVTTSAHLRSLVRSLIDSGGAWNVCRAVQVAQQGYLIGLLSARESASFQLEAARKMQQTYSGWDDMYSDYLKGLLLWSYSSQDAEERSQCIDDIRANSMFRDLNWNLELPAALKPAAH